MLLLGKAGPFMTHPVPQRSAQQAYSRRPERVRQQATRQQPVMIRAAKDRRVMRELQRRASIPSPSQSRASAGVKVGYKELGSIQEL